MRVLVIGCLVATAACDAQVLTERAEDGGARDANHIQPIGTPNRLDAGSSPDTSVARAEVGVPRSIDGGVSPRGDATAPPPRDSGGMLPVDAGVAQDAPGTQSPDATSVVVPPQAMRLLAGGDDTCIMSAAGHVACWGDNEVGELGAGDFVDRWTPTWLPGVAGVVDLAVGDFSMCLRDVDGKLSCWGMNAYHELGVTVGNCPALGYPCSDVPVGGPVVGAGPLVAGVQYFCVALADGSGVQCWGDAPSVDTTGYDSVAAACGDFHVCVRFDAAAGQDPTRNVVCYTQDDGFNHDTAGQRGTGPFDGSAPPASGPVATGVSGGFVELAAGMDFTCGVGAAGELLSWGDNTFGELGLGAEGDEASFPSACLSPSSQGGLSVAACAPEPTQVTGLPPVAHVAAHYGQACAVTTTGDVYCWGSPSQTSPASMSACFSASPTCSPTPLLVSGVANAVSIAVGYGHACAATADGDVYCWGLDTHGQLGRGQGGPSFDPTPAMVVLPPEPM